MHALPALCQPLTPATNYFRSFLKRGFGQEDWRVGARILIVRRKRGESKRTWVTMTASYKMGGSGGGGEIKREPHRSKNQTGYLALP